MFDWFCILFYYVHSKQNYFQAFLFQNYKLWVPSSMVLLQELLLYIWWDLQSARFYILLGEILLCKMLHSTWRLTHFTTGVSPIDSTILHRELHLYRSFPSKGTLESPIDSTRATYSPNSTNKNFLLEESTRAFCKEKSGQEFYQRKYF